MKREGTIEKVKTAYGAALRNIGTAAFMGALFTMPVFAAPNGKTMWDALFVILQALIYIMAAGIGLWSMAQLAMSLFDENPSGRKGAVFWLVVAIFLAALPTLLKTANLGQFVTS